MNITNIQKDQCGRVLQFNLKIEDMLVTICGVYAPNNDSPAFFQDIRKMLSKGSEHKILIGDFNLVMNPQIDRIDSNHNKQKSLEVIKSICDEFSLVDIFRSKNENIRRFSWYRSKLKLMASRIDFSLILIGLDDNCKNVGYTTGLKTDHLAHFLYLLLHQNERGPGYWKLNTTYLSHLDYVNLMNDCLEMILNTSHHVSIQNRWEYLKYKVKDESRTYAVTKVSEKNLIIAQLSENIQNMESQLDDADCILLQNTKDDLNDFMMEKAQACIFKSKARYAELGEKPSTYFFNLEKARFNARTCNALYNKNNKVMTDTQGILKLQEEFYQELYTKDPMV